MRIKELAKIKLFGKNATHGIGWIILGIFFWWAGIAGRDLYLIPILVGILITAYNIYKNNIYKNILLNFESFKTFASCRTLIVLLFVHGILLAATAVLKLYSFQWNIWDVGYYSDILFNTSRGNFYSSYFSVHNWADHFTPSFSFLSIFYFISPSSHWMTLSKIVALIISPILIWKICSNLFEEKKYVYYFGLVLSLFWLFFYAPIVNSSYFAFHPSSLAAPAIFYSFLCLQKKEWWKMTLIFIFLIGLKEHVASVLIGFGLYMIINTYHKKTGLIFIIFGISAIIIIMWYIMPFYRNYAPAWTAGNIENISLFTDVGGKLIYLFKLLMPFAFLPIIFWKFGIIAGPAIGVNLLATTKNLYSTSFHYDDLTAPLLFISVILSFNQIIKLDFAKKFIKKRFYQGLVLLWGCFVFALLPASPMRILWNSIPSYTDFKILNELNKFDQISQGKRIAVQSSIGPLFHREKLHWYIQKNDELCGMESHIFSIKSIPVEYVVLAPEIGHYGIDDMDLCLRQLSKDLNASKVSGFDHLMVYKRINNIVTEQ